MSGQPFSYPLEERVRIVEQFQRDTGEREKKSQDSQRAIRKAKLEKATHEVMREAKLKKSKQNAKSKTDEKEV